MTLKNKRNLVPLYEVQKKAHEEYLVNPRTFQWYVTKGLVLKATKIGREAFYEIEEDRVNVYDYVGVIKYLQYNYDLSTAEIREVIKKYEKQLNILLKMLQQLTAKCPIALPLEGPNSRVHKRFLAIITGDDVVDLKNLSVEVLIKEVRGG